MCLLIVCGKSLLSSKGFAFKVQMAHKKEFKVESNIK